MVQQRVLQALADGMMALLDCHLAQPNSSGKYSNAMSEARDRLIRAMLDEEPPSWPYVPKSCKRPEDMSKLEISARVAKEMQEMRDKYPLGAVIRVDRINQHEHMAFLYPEDQRIKGIAVMNEWIERNRVRLFESHGYFVLTPDGYTSWLPGACVMSR